MGNLPKDAAKDKDESQLDEGVTMPCFGRIKEHRWCARTLPEIKRSYADDPKPND